MKKLTILFIICFFSSLPVIAQNRLTYDLKVPAVETGINKVFMEMQDWT